MPTVIPLESETTRLIYYTLGLIWAFAVFAGCYENRSTSDPHPCDACRPCETCETVTTGKPVCRIHNSVAKQCGANGVVVFFNSCGELEPDHEQCPPNAECTNTSDITAVCQCRNQWTGKNCDKCEGNWDKEQNCGVCKNQWTGDNCDICPGNWDKDQNCSVCRNHWTGDNCDVCPGNWSAETDCAECANHWMDEDNNCGTCPQGFIPGTDCTECLPGWNGSACDTQETCIRYVRSDTSIGAPNGYGWTTAYNDVNTAILSAEATITKQDGPTTCDVWVAAGRYNIYKSSRRDSVTLKPKINLFGGFDGTETALHQRDVALNKTILDGQENGGEQHVFHVVTGSDDAVIDGFTITGGWADGEDRYGMGGGMLNYDVSPTVRQCSFENNYAATAGGGMFNTSVDTIAIDSCIFKNNKTDKSGGAMRNYEVEVSIVDTVFSNNVAESGGAISIFNTDAGYTHIVQSIFDSNAASAKGGAIAAGGGELNTTNSVFIQNDASAIGGAIFSVRDALREVTNTTFYGNSASTGGGTIYLQSHDGYTTITNSIIWLSSPDVTGLQDSPEPLVQYSDVQNGFLGEGNIDADPLFMDALNGDLRLSDTSPCIDAANGLVAPPTDLIGNDRFDDPNTADTGTGNAPHPDMGAYEFIR